MTLPLESCAAAPVAVTVLVGGFDDVQPFLVCVFVHVKFVNWLAAVQTAYSYLRSTRSSLSGNGHVVAAIGARLCMNTVS